MLGQATKRMQGPLGCGQMTNLRAAMAAEAHDRVGTRCTKRRRILGQEAVTGGRSFTPPSERARKLSGMLLVAALSHVRHHRVGTNCCKRSRSGDSG
jgi:hypothetical protein